MRFLFLLLSLLGLQMVAPWHACAEEERPFIITVNIPEDSKDFFVRIKGDVNGSGASDYTIDWGDGNTTKGGSSSEEEVSHTYAEAGEYQVSMSGKLPHITFSVFFGQASEVRKNNAAKVLFLDAWGTNQWYSASFMFNFARNIQGRNTDVPDFSLVSDMRYMFRGAKSFNGDLNSWDVSNVTDMSSMFFGANSFNGDLSDWDVGNVADMSYMFCEATIFNDDLSNWDVSNVKNMSLLFSRAINFNGDLSNWDVGNVTRMSSMFFGANSFNGDLSSWDVGNVTSVYQMFRSADSFNGDLSSWDVSSVTNMSAMFCWARNFNSDLSSWDVGNVTSMYQMFSVAPSFNSDLSSWDVGNVTNMYQMFNSASSFNSDLSSWDVGNVTNMSQMFDYAMSFNSDLSSWDVSNVTDMSRMFYSAISFNSDLSSWDVSKVESMEGMFSWTNNFAAGNYDELLYAWSQLPLQSNVVFRAPAYYCNEADYALREKLISEKGWTITESTQNCSALVRFNTLGGNPASLVDQYAGQKDQLVRVPQVVPEKDGQPCVGWATSNDGGQTLDFAWDFMKDQAVENMTLYAKYDYQIWASATGGATIFEDQVTLTPGDSYTFTVNVPEGKSVLYWSVNGVRQSVQGNSFTIENIQADHRLKAVVGNADDFIVTVKIPEDSKDFYVKIHGNVNESGASDYTIDWGDGNITTGGSDAIETIDHTYESAGEYQVSISGKLPQMTFSGFGEWLNSSDSENAEKVISLDSWGNNQWYSLANLFYGAGNFIYNTDAVPDLTHVTTMRNTFREAGLFNADLNAWDVSNVELMIWTFRGARSFTGNISDWDVSNVTHMGGLFSDCPFNGDLSRWDVSQVTSMGNMFSLNSQFNQNIGGWDVSKVTDMERMFDRATVFNQNLNAWDVSQVTKMNSMFEQATSFDGDISSWNVGHVTDMNAMFYDARSFNSDISSWDVSNVTNMSSMFRAARSFNGDVSSWDVSQVTDMNSMFRSAYIFDSDVSSWDVRHVTDMNALFGHAYAFDSDVSSWDVSNVTNMNSMFEGARLFNGDVSSWDVSSVRYMQYMFYDAYPFNGDLSTWELSSLESASRFIQNTSLTDEDYERMLISWSEQQLPAGVVLEVDLAYCSVEAFEAHEKLAAKGWDLRDGGRSCDFDQETAAVKPQGDGTEGTPYLISNLAELRWLSEGISGGMTDEERWAGKYYKVTNIIDAIETQQWNDGLGLMPIGNTTTAFTGVFDGQSNDIFSLRINDNQHDDIGFFGKVDGATIKNVTLTDLSIAGKEKVGLIASARNSQIENIHIQGDVEGVDYTGAIVGFLSNSKVATADLQVNVKGANSVGGAVGYANYIFGLGGYDTDIRNIAIKGKVEGTEYVGGLVGDAMGANIVNSYSLAEVNGGSNVGGIVAQNNTGRTAHVYAAGKINASGSNVGGVIGVETVGLLVENVYWDKEVTGKTSSAGSSENAGLATADFATSSNFKSWDFDALWAIGIEGNQKRPFFQRNLLAVNVSTDGNGSVEGNDYLVRKGGSISLKAVPNENYVVDQVTVNGEPIFVGEQGSFVVANVQAAVKVEVAFKLRTYQVTATVNEGATISPEVVDVTHGSDQSFTLTLDPGYQLKHWILRDVVGSIQDETSTTFVLKNVQKSYLKVEAVVEPAIYTLMVTQARFGTISPETTNLSYGESQTFTITPVENGGIEDVLVDGKSVGAVETYTFEAVDADHEITAIFTRILSNDQQVGIHVYPNPVQEHLHFAGLSKQATVQFVDAMGRIVLKTVVAPNASTVDVSPLGTGLYQVMLDGQVIEKLLKE
ncbi:BspA family leucine-rich repeat surface protein [Persicobacter psychrovividus]|uniref:PKD domain-containing protein n=1 Tax=Persicobacter psychrovividus TaxID=387638 RepID=A0ABN6L9E6_9BACT|nr:hypothetical protein PEPS_20960 [Persicobacter psychrovividus]